jgi:hypothetical protein
MRCAVSAALVATTAVAAAGCGSTSTSPADVAVNQAHEYGGTEAQAVRTERRRIANGDAVDVVLVRARFCGPKKGHNGVTMPKVHGRCVPSVVYFATQPGRKGGLATLLLPGAARMTAEARKARTVFRIFPDVPDLLVRCRIPRAGGGTVAGLCEAKLYRSRGIEFLEHWPLSRPVGDRNTAGWVVTLDRGDHVVGVQRTGSTPPQATSASRASNSGP